MTKLIAYYRVSTQRQGNSGLGLEAQQAAVEAHSKSIGATIVAFFTEVESGRKNRRPELQRALAACRQHSATLCIAKLDRLSRNLYFVASLMESKIDFVCCDNPHANRLTIQILACIAEHEAQIISERTKAALSAAKARGKRLGGRNMTPAIASQGNAANVTAAQQHAAKALPLAQQLRNAGQTLAQIASELTEQGILTRRGLPWSATAVSRLLSC